MLLIQMLGVSKIYENNVAAIKDLSVRIKKGEFVFIVGQSGAGKSTFLRLLFREELPTTGQIVIGGRSVIRLRRKEVPILRRNIGVVFQDFKLLPQKNVFENVAFAMEVTETPRIMIEKKVPEILDLVGLVHKGKVMPHQLSGGEQQRVAIARGIVNDPLILFADEPTGNLDPETSWEIMDVMKNINQRGTTVIMATHDRDIVDTMKKRVLELDHGQLVRDESGGGYDEAKKYRLLL